MTDVWLFVNVYSRNAVSFLEFWKKGDKEEGNRNIELWASLV